eukprot:TRINITY_DN2024_c0_g1_i5.p1 TRINITY_DN2024_c0_g1~~TRINITY_DN2024_c0_g1_i5.p1  ORF type:complete len:485 (+),score=226.43 TRINITY_DN2024_c0_g1_i5:537-1991(+)
MMNDRAKLRELFIAYQTRFHHLKDQLKNLAGLIAERDSVIEKLNAMAREKRAESQKLHEESANLKKRLIEKTEEIERLKRDLIDLQRENDRLNSLLAQWQQANERLSAELTELRKAYEDKCREVDEALDEINKLKTANAELMTILDRLKMLLEQLKLEYSELVKQFSLLQEKNKELRKGNDILTSEMENLKHRHDDLTEKYNILIKTHKDAQAENDKLKDTLEECMMNIKPLEAENAKYAREIMFYKEKVSTGVGDMQGENKRLMEINMELKQANRRLKDANEQLRNDLEKLKNEANSLQGQLDDLMAKKAKRKEDRLMRKEQKWKKVEEAKSAMTNLTPEANPDNPVVMYSRKPGETVLKKPIIKAFIEYEAGMGGNVHYITHPCPRCMPEFPVQCPMHNMGMSTVTYSIDEAKTHLRSKDEKERIRALESIIVYSETDPKFKELIESKYGNAGVISILQDKNWENFIEREVSKIEKKTEEAA